MVRRYQALMLVSVSVAVALYLTELPNWNRQDRDLSCNCEVNDSSSKGLNASLAKDNENDGNTRNLIPMEMENLIGHARLIKIYVPAMINLDPGLETKYHGSPAFINDSQELLQPYASWFRIHAEYSSHQYMLHRSRNDPLTFTEDQSQADFCYPGCGNISSSSPRPLIMKLQVTPRSEAKFSGCKWIQISVEYGMDDRSIPPSCRFIVPYWHSVYAPSRHAAAPWSSTARRSILLCFIGGSWRGKNLKRGIAIDEMTKVSHAASLSAVGHAGRNQTLFSAPFYFKTHGQEKGVWATGRFFTDVWSLYAASVFSWQPRGDTLTRRGFFDSWMLGCIPVVSTASADSYRRLFSGAAFAAAGVAFEDTAVVLDDAAFQSGGAVLSVLAGILPEEVRRRRLALAALAPVMQWGYDDADDRADALLMALAGALAK